MTGGRLPGRRLAVAAVTAVLVAACSGGGPSPDVEAFCAEVRSLDAELADVVPRAVELAEPVDVEALRATLEDLRGLLRVAPPEVAADTEVLVDLYAEVVEALAATTSTDPADVVAALAGVIDDPAEAARVAEAGERFDAFVTTRCGQPPAGADPPGSTTAGS